MGLEVSVARGATECDLQLEYVSGPDRHQQTTDALGLDERRHTLPDIVDANLSAQLEIYARSRSGVIFSPAAQSKASMAATMKSTSRPERG